MRWTRAISMPRGRSWTGTDNAMRKSGMEKKTVLANGIVCIVKKSRRARRLRITMRRDGSVTLTLPFFVSYERGRIFLENHADWIREKKSAFALRPETLLLRGGTEEYRASCDDVRALVETRLAYFSKRYGVAWKKISIRNQKTRWGSCSRNGNLSFNYRLLHLPSHLADYVIVHEICHLLQFDHSPRFWAFVGQSIPDYPALRRELRLL